VQWGTDTILYRKNHPMLWKGVSGNYQNWEIDVAEMIPSDAESAHGEPAKLFYSDDMTVSISRRKESMPYFYRNCDADELHLINKGKMVYETDFGNIEVGERDFLVIPKGVTYRASVNQPQETLRIVYESEPEIFVVPAEMVEHIYRKGRPALKPDVFKYPELPKGKPPEGKFEVRVKYKGAFSEFLGETTSITYDFYPLDTELIDGYIPVFKFSIDDIEKLGSTPVAFLGAAYLDNKNNMAWTMHLSGGGVGSAPVHRDPDGDELRYTASGAKIGNFLFTPHGVDHGGGRGYTKKERNRAPDAYDIPDSISAYTLKPLKGTQTAQRYARPREA
jgi:homogentisate 1,2-dioxygenase